MLTHDVYLLIEKCVPKRQKAVSRSDCLSNQLHLSSTVEPGLPSLRVNVSVRPEERLESGRLVPADKQLSVRIAKESTHVGAAESHPGHAQGEAHGDGGLKVAPVRCVVARPDGCVPLTASVSTSRQDKWPQLVITSYQVSL